ncbi:MAG: hypothetical protein HW386_2453 [Gammaproteobacteria bacterium]|nr:hypothetical protein [Gammaproteobacteria bacterium]
MTLRQKTKSYLGHIRLPYNRHSRMEITAKIPFKWRITVNPVDSSISLVMIKLYSSDDTVLIGHLQSVLEEAGITCWIKNRFLAAGIGELPPTAVWPELWLHQESDINQAMTIISPIIKPPAARHSPWQCHCGERLEGQFDCCWQCGRLRPAL